MNESVRKSTNLRRKDRLIQLITLMRDGELHTALDLAQYVDVSLRTLYRDMDTLRLSGLPIIGERGVGYYMNAQVTLPPLNLTQAELEALHLGLAVMSEASDPDLQANAKSLAKKIDNALPEEGLAETTGWGLAVYPFADTAAGIRHIPSLRRAIRSRQKLKLTIAEARNEKFQNIVHPLKLEFWGRVWTLTLWSENQNKPMLVRVDKIVDLTELNQVFELGEISG
jgi:predicted DNA-binding transcriptional regulator YafY